MKRILLIIGMLVAIVCPSVAPAKSPNPGCASSNPADHATGMVVGGIAGALLGNALSHKKEKAAGTVGGGITGASVDTDGNRFTASRLLTQRNGGATHIEPGNG